MNLLTPKVERALNIETRLEAKVIEQALDESTGWLNERPTLKLERLKYRLTRPLLLDGPKTKKMFYGIKTTDGIQLLRVPGRTQSSFQPIAHLNLVETANKTVIELQPKPFARTVRLTRFTGFFGLLISSMCALVLPSEITFKWIFPFFGVAFMFMNRGMASMLYNQEVDALEERFKRLWSSKR